MFSLSFTYSPDSSDSTLTHAALCRLGAGLVLGLICFKGGGPRIAVASAGAGFGAGHAFALESVRFNQTKASLAAKLAEK